MKKIVLIMLKRTINSCAIVLLLSQIGYSSLLYTIAMPVGYLSEEYGSSASKDNLFNDNFFDDSFDMAGFDEEDISDNFLDTEVPLRAIDPVAIMMILDAIGAPALLQEPLYLHTNILNKRDVLDFPLFEPIGCGALCGWHFDTSFFYNQMNRAYFTKDSSDLDSYLALSKPSLIDAIENLLIPIRDQFDLDVRKLFDLFGFMTTQERRVGFMLQTMYQGTSGMMRFMLPLYYRERNFFLDKARQAQVEAEFEPGDPEEQDKFRREHFVSDEIGFGDMRFEGYYHLVDKPSVSFSLGMMATVPTAVSFKRGLYGSYYPKPSGAPLLNLDEFITLLTDGTLESQKAAFELVSNYALGAVDRLAANLLDTNLGNQKHFGIGFCGFYTSLLSSWLNYSWTQPITFKSKGSIEFLIPAHERRLFIKKVDAQGFASRDFTSDNPIIAQDNLFFLQQALTNQLYLYGFNARIQPGVIFRLTNKICYQRNNWDAYLGSDWWIQTREHIQHVCGKSAAIAQLDLPKAKLSTAIQYKLLGGFDYTLRRDTHDITLGLAVDGTIYSKAIGKDFTALARCTVLF